MLDDIYGKWIECITVFGANEGSNQRKMRHKIFKLEKNSQMLIVERQMKMEEKCLFTNPVS